jgi:membrane associated rhomboid family serine protease
MPSLSGVKPFKPPQMSRVTRGLILACLAVQVAITVAGPVTGSELAMRFALIPARLSGALEGMQGNVPAVLTPLTSMFLHFGWAHLILNLVFLGLVGRHVEWVLGPARFLALFVGGGLAAAAVQILSDPLSTYPVAGASGAISAVFGCYALLFARRRATARRLLGRTIPSGVLTALWFAAVWIGVQLLTGLVAGMSGLGIAIWAHIGGFIVGLLYAAPYLRAARPER